MKTHHLLLAVLSLSGCSKSESKPTPAPMAKPVEAAPAVAPKPAPAPTPAPAPAKNASDHVAEAMKVMTEISQNKLSADKHFSVNQTVAFIDYATTPQGKANHIEKAACVFEGGGGDVLDAVRASISSEAGRIASALVNDGVSCTETRKDLVTCNVAAQDEQEAALTLWFNFASGLPTIAGYARRETFMITDDARLTREEKQRDAAFAKLSSKECLSERERDAIMDERR